MELSITIKDETIEGMEWALEAIMRSLKRERTKKVQTIHGLWEYVIERRAGRRESAEESV